LKPGIAAARLLMLVPLAPRIAAGQAPIVPPAPAVSGQIIINPRTPPPGDHPVSA
jgi:hypothetical protein